VYTVLSHDRRRQLQIAIFRIMTAECIFLILLALLLLLLLQTRFCAIGVGVQPSALNRRNAEMQLKRRGVEATCVALMHRSMPLTSITT